MVIFLFWLSCKFGQIQPASLAPSKGEKNQSVSPLKLTNKHGIYLICLYISCIYLLTVQKRT